VHQLNSKSGLPLGLTEHAADRHGTEPILLPDGASAAVAGGPDLDVIAAPPGASPSSLVFRLCLLQRYRPLDVTYGGENGDFQWCGAALARGAAASEMAARKQRLMETPAFKHWVRRERPPVVFRLPQTAAVPSVGPGGAPTS